MVWSIINKFVTATPRKDTRKESKLEESKESKEKIQPETSVERVVS